MVPCATRKKRRTSAGFPYNSAPDAHMGSTGGKRSCRRLRLRDFTRSRLHRGESRGSQLPLFQTPALADAGGTLGDLRWAPSPRVAGITYRRTDQFRPTDARRTGCERMGISGASVAARSGLRARRPAGRTHVSERELIAYALIAVLAAALAGLVWWRRYQSYPQIYARQQKRRRAQDDARMLARLESAERDQAS